MFPIDQIEGAAEAAVDAFGNVIGQIWVAVEAAVRKQPILQPSSKATWQHLPAGMTNLDYYAQQHMFTPQGATGSIRAYLVDIASGMSPNDAYQHETIRPLLPSAYNRYETVPMYNADTRPE